MISGCDVSALDQPEVLKYLFHPRKNHIQAAPQDAVDFFIPVEKGVQLGARFYPADHEEPHILFFHEIGRASCRERV